MVACEEVDAEAAGLEVLDGGGCGGAEGGLQEEGCAVGGVQSYAEVGALAGLWVGEEGRRQRDGEPGGRTGADDVIGGGG